MSEKQRESPQKIKELQNMQDELGRPYIGLTDDQLITEIDNQKFVVSDCVSFAQKAAADANHPDLMHLDGLYFANQRLQDLTKELQIRFTESRIQQERNQ